MIPQHSSQPFMLFAFCHVGLSVLLTFVDVVPCISCRRKWVPETILSTIEPSPALAIRGAGELLEARVCRTRKGVEILSHPISSHPISHPIAFHSIPSH